MSQSINETLGVSFSNDYDLETSINKRKFEYVLIQFAKHAFLGAEPKITTRTNKEDVSELVQKWIKEFDAQEGTEEGNGGGETEGPNKQCASCRSIFHVIIGQLVG